MADPKVLREIRYHATETTEMCWQAGFSSTDAAARWAATYGNNLLDALGRICNPPTDCDPKKWAENWAFAQSVLAKANATQPPKGSDSK